MFRSGWDTIKRLLASANIWTGIQTFVSAVFTTITATTGNITTVNATTVTADTMSPTALNHLVTLVTDSSTGNVSAANMKGQIHRVTGAYTLTLPTGAAGMNATFRATTASTYSIKAGASNNFILRGTALDNGDKITSIGGAGDTVSIYWDDVVSAWIADSMNVLFTDGGA
jgi:hypothetical protein